MRDTSTTSYCLWFDATNNCNNNKVDHQAETQGVDIPLFKEKKVDTTVAVASRHGDG